MFRIAVYIVFVLIALSVQLSAQITILEETFKTTSVSPWNGAGMDNPDWQVIQGSAETDDIRVLSTDIDAGTLPPSGSKNLTFYDCDNGGSSPSYDLVYYAVDLSSYTDVYIDYYWQSDDVDADEGLWVHYSTNSTDGTDGAWTLINAHINPTDDTWSKETFSLPDAACQSGFMLRFTSLSNATSENMFVDDIKIYSLPKSRYAIVNNGNWNAGATWSYTSGGGTCSCTPDQNSKVHIGEAGAMTVQMNVDGDANNVTIYSSGTLKWTAANVELNIYNSGTVTVNSGGYINGNGQTEARIELEDATTTSLVVNDATNGVSLDDIYVNSDAAVLNINGTGKIALADDFRLYGDACSVTNDLTGTFTVGDDIHFRDDNCSFTNNQTIVVTDDIMFINGFTASLFNNTGTITADLLDFEDDDNEFRNSGTATFSSGLYVGAGTYDNNFVTNNSPGILNFNSNVDCQSANFYFYNYSELTITGALNNIPGTNAFYNYAGATFNYGGATYDNSINLYCNYDANIVDYNRAGAQNIIDPVDNYWSLKISTSGTKTSQANLDINGNLTIQNSAVFDVGTGADDINIAGNWIENSDNATPFVPGTRTVTFDGISTIQGSYTETFYDVTITGTLSGKSSGNFNVKRHFVNSGTFTHNSGTVTFNGSTVDQNITSGGSSFFNLTINNTAAAGNDDIMPQDALAVANDLTLTDGDMNANGRDISVGRHWVNSGTGASFTPGTRTVTLNGSAADQNITSAGYSFYNLIINNTAADGSDDILLQDALAVANTLTITDGDLNANAKDITIGSNWTNNSGTFTHGGSNKVTFNSSTADQNIKSNSSAFYNIDFNNSAGAGSDDLILTDLLKADNNLTITNGDLNSNGQNIEIKGNWTNTGGSFTHSSSEKVTFNSSAADQTITTLGFSFWNLELNNSAADGSDDILPGDALDVDNILTIANGDLNANGFDITVGGNWTNTGGSFTHGSNNKVTFNGSSDQTITSNTQSFFNIEINKGGGSILLGDDMSQVGNSTLTLTVGKIVLGANDLTIPSGGSISGTFDATKCIQADGTGFLKKVFGGAGAFTFPVGDADEYSPVVVNFNSADSWSGTVEINVTDAVHGSMNTTGTSYITRWWEINGSGFGAAFNYDFDVVYLDADIVGTETDIYGALWNGTQWFSGKVTETDGANTLSRDGNTTFSNLSGGSIGALPVELVEFRADIVDNKVLLTWITASEKNNDYFTIEKSRDLKQFETIGVVKGAGNNNTMLQYTLVDDKPYEGTFYYRLKQTDYDGKTTCYKDRVSVTFQYGSNQIDNNRIGELLVFPNPVLVNSKFYIQFKNLDQNSEILVVVNDLLGNQLYSKIIMTDYNGDVITAIDPEQHLLPGIYIITGTSQNEIYSKKLIIR